MSALDRAFIRAYAKDAAPNSPPGSSGNTTSNSSVNAQVARPATPAAYDTGPLYRVDYEPSAAAPVIPAPHQRFARTGNSLRSRYTTVHAQDAEPDSQEPAAPPSALQPVERLLADVRPMLREPAPLPPVAAVPRTTPAREPEPVRSLRTPGLDLVARRLAGSSADGELDLPLVVEDPIVRPTPTSFVETVVADLTPAVSPPVVAPVTVNTPDFTPSPSILVFTPALDLAAAAPAPKQDEVKPAEAKAEPNYRLDAPAQTTLQGPHFKTKSATEKNVAEKPAEAAKPVEVAKPIEAPAAPKPPAWEVDAFQWPDVCQRLLSDSSSYFAQAGAKLQAAVKDGLHTLGVAGSARGEGASTLALSLAKAAVQAGLKVALVDADFVDPQLAVRLGLDIDAGWQAAANGHVPLHESAVLSLSDKLTFYPLQKNAELSLTDPWAVATLRKIQESFDLTLVDLGPLAAGDAPLFAKDEPPPFDAVVIVRDIRRTPLDHAQAVAGRLYAAGIEAVGIAENFVS